MLLKDLKKELDKIAVDPYFTLAHTLVESGYTEEQIANKLCSKELASIPDSYKLRLLNFVRDIERR